MANKKKKKSSKKGNIITNNKVVSSLLIGAGAGILIGLISKTDTFEGIKDMIVDKSKKAMEDFPAFAKTKENSVENTPVS